MAEFSTKREDNWLRRATAVAIAEARKVALDDGALMNTPVGRLNESQWGWIITAAIFGWIKTRVEQAIEEGLDSEETVRGSGVSPSPCDVAVVHSVLPALCDQSAIDWALPLSAWSKDTMTNFLMTAWRLMNRAEIARDHGPGRIIRKSKQEGSGDADIPF
jgi:hypothetical protein